jgi:hypothetical protein
MNPYESTPAASPAMLGRRRVYQDLAAMLSRRPPLHRSVIGPRMNGKTVILRQLATDGAVTSKFAASFYWDLRHDPPRGDDAFRLGLARALDGAFARAGRDDLRDTSLDFESVTLALKEIHGANQTVLAILDGIDRVLDERLVTRQVWDNLKALSDAGLTLVCASRQRLGELCDHDSFTSDFWEVFGVPVEVGPFEDADWDDVLAPLTARRTVDPSARKELRAWTGGQPRLVIELLLRLGALGGDHAIAKVHVDAAAEALLRERPESLTHLWKRECDEVLRGVLTDLVANESLPASQVAPRERGRLAALGMLTETGTKISCASRLMARHIQGTGGSEHGLRRLFANEADYARNIGSLLELRLAHVKGGDPHLRSYVEKALRDISPADPLAPWRIFRDIVEAALDLVFAVEAPGAVLPESWKAVGSPLFPSNGRPPKRRGSSCRLLDAATGTDDLDPVARYVSKRTVALLDALTTAGDVMNHKRGARMPEVMPIASTASFCAVAVELFAAITAEIPLKA